MLGIVLISLGLCAVGVLVVVVGAREITRRLGLDALEVLVWLGVAERPVQPIPRRNRRLEPPVVERRPVRHQGQPSAARAASVRRSLRARHGV